MKRLSVFILLLLHMNSFMLLPQVDEQDSYDANGQQQDDINSVIEYVRVVLGYDKTADDEDNDTGEHFLLLKACDYFYQQQVVILERPDLTEQIHTDYPEFNDSKTTSVSYDIIAPPPEA